MRRAVLCQAFVVVWGVLACCAAAEAGWPFGPKQQETAPKQEAAPAVQEPQEAGPDPAELEQRRISAEVHTQLDGSTWTLNAKPYRAANASAKPFTDELTFEGGKMHSKRFKQAGYASSMYSVNVQGDVRLWETMQRKEGEGTLTWSGELYGNSMGGVVTKRPSDPEKHAEHFRFTGTLVPKTPPMPETPVTPETPSAAPAPAGK